MGKGVALVLFGFLLLCFIGINVNAMRNVNQAVGVNITKDAEEPGCYNFKSRGDSNITINMEKICYYPYFNTKYDKGETTFAHMICNKDPCIEISIDGKKYFGGFSTVADAISYSDNTPGSESFYTSTMINEVLTSNNNSFYVGKINIIESSEIEPGTAAVLLGGIIIEDNEGRISKLESWRKTIDDWKNSINTTLTTIQNSIFNILGTLTKNDARISTLENKTSTTNISYPNYFKYMSSSDRKQLVCGYGVDNNKTTMNDLGWNCNVTYKTSSSGKVSTDCKCKELK